MELSQLKTALSRLCQNVGGDWLLLGGSLVRFDVDPARGTHDIDLMRMPPASDPRQVTQLINEMRAVGLSPEQVNSAVGYFVQSFADWEGHTVELHREGNGRIFRPTLTLFAALKFRRGTPIDLEDVRKARAKWGDAEWDARQFALWSDEKMRQHAKALGL